MIWTRKTDDLDAHTYRLPYSPNDLVVFKNETERSAVVALAFSLSIQIIGLLVRLASVIPSEVYRRLAKPGELCIFSSIAESGQG